MCASLVWNNTTQVEGAFIPGAEEQGPSRATTRLDSTRRARAAAFATRAERGRSGEWREAIAVDVARTPLARLSH